MAKEEKAIKRLTDFEELNCCVEEDNEAVQEAIKALKKESHRIIEAEEFAKDLADRLNEKIAKEARYLHVDEKWYFEKVVQYMRAESEIHCTCTSSEITKSFIEDVEAVKDLLPQTEIKQESDWIPVSKRLPEKDGEYLLWGRVTEDEENNIFIGEYDSCGEQFGYWQEQYTSLNFGCLGAEFYEYESVIAWMPLPEPYKEESEDK